MIRRIDVKKFEQSVASMFQGSIAQQTMKDALKGEFESGGQIEFASLNQIFDACERASEIAERAAQILVDVSNRVPASLKQRAVGAVRQMRQAIEIIDDLCEAVDEENI